MPNLKRKPLQKPPAKNFLLFIVIFLVSAVIINQLGKKNIPQEISYSDFKNHVRQGQIKDVIFSGLKASGKLILQGKEENYSTTLPTIDDSQLITLLETNNVKVTGVSDEPSYLTMMVLNFLPWILIIGFFVYSSRKMKDSLGGMGKGGLPFQQSMAKKFTQTNTSIKFDDVAGLEGAKKDLQEIVEFMKHPQKYNEFGAKLPKGILLMGPPGTGKTMLAKATAGEAGVPFFSISGSEFIELFVGVGASRVRNMFTEAKAVAPAIIFIDEIDSIGRARGTGLGGGHDEREQTLNQILSEMDGFEEGQSVVVMAATNRPDVLDPALIRPGRFDRQVTLDLPNKGAREKILKIHGQKSPLAADVSYSILASLTIGFSGADLRNLVNEAALFALRESAKEISMSHFEKAREKVLMGNTRDEKLEHADKKIVAYHEAGHTLVASVIPGADPIRKVSIIPRGRALGVTEQMPQEETYNVKKTYLENQIMVLLGGRLAEELIFNDVTTGAEDDLKRATRLARKMIVNWGMSERIGLVAYKQGEEHRFLGKEISQDRDYSEATAKIIDDEIKILLDDKKRKVQEILIRNRSKLEHLAEELLSKEELDSDAIQAIVKA